MTNSLHLTRTQLRRLRSILNGAIATTREELAHQNARNISQESKARIVAIYSAELGERLELHSIVNATLQG